MCLCACVCIAWSRSCRHPQRGEIFMEWRNRRRYQAEKSWLEVLQVSKCSSHWLFAFLLLPILPFSLLPSTFHLNFFSIYSRHCLMQYCAENHGWLFYWKYNSATKRLLHWWSLAIFWITFQICLTRKSVLAFSFNRDHSSWAPIKRTVWWQKSQLH